MGSGRPFGDYQLGRRLGAGSMAEVFLAHRRGPSGFHKQVVIKRIHPHLSAKPRFAEMFEREARLAAALDHPHLVQVFDFGEIDGSTYIAMEHVDGIGLGPLLDTVGGALAPGAAARIGVDLLDALHAVHSARGGEGSAGGLVHRDISPGNVMLSRAGSVKLLDLGIAAIKGQTDQVAAGTGPFMSPEQRRGAALDGRSDLYSVGVLLYWTVVGRFPDQGEQGGVTRTRPAELPAALWELLRSLLAEDPAGRPASARTAQQALELFLATRPIEGTRARLGELAALALGPAERAADTELLGATETITRERRSAGAPRLRREALLFGLVGFALGAGGWIVYWLSSR